MLSHHLSLLNNKNLQPNNNRLIILHKAMIFLINRTNYDQNYYRPFLFLKQKHIEYLYLYNIVISSDDSIVIYLTLVI